MPHVVILETGTVDAARSVAGLAPRDRHSRAALAAGLTARFVKPEQAVEPPDETTFVVPDWVTYHRLLLARLASVHVDEDEVVRVGDARASIHLVGRRAAARFHSEARAGTPRFDRELPLLHGEFVVPADSDDALDHATELHLLSLRKKTAGFVDRLLLRDLARPITRALLGTSITPNAVSVIAFAIVVAAAGCVLVGTRADVGAFALLMLARVVDCVDGELARIRYQTSKLGEWLDGTLDSIGVGIVLGCIAYRMELTDAGFAPIGWLSVAAWVMSSTVMVMALARVDSGAFQAIGWEHRRAQDTWLQRALKRIEGAFQIDAISLWLGLGVLTSAHRATVIAFTLAGLGVSVYGLYQLAAGKVGARAEAVRK